MARTSENKIVEDVAIDATPDPVVSQTSETVEVPILNRETDTWEMTKVDRAKGETIVAGMVTESWERGGGDRMATNHYDSRMHRTWVCIERSDPSTLRALELGYRPVRDKAAATQHGHQFGKVPGWDGQSVNMGDAILMEVPIAMAEAREAQVMEARRREKLSAETAARDHMSSVLDPYRSSNDNTTGVIDNYNGRNYNYNRDAGLDNNVLTADAEDRALMAARSLERAQAFMNSESPSDRGGRLAFGGFRSKSGMDSAIPESPLVRRLTEKQLGG